MDERDSENVFDDIIITHFINPSMFWYRVAAEPLPELVDLEQKLAKQFSTQKYLTQYEPKKNEIVAVYDVAGTRYCRARVEHVLEFLHEPNKYMLWAFDIGQLLQSRARFIKELPDELAQIQIENVYYGGLNNIVPAVQNFDFYQNMNVTEVVNKWSEKSCRVFEEVTKNAYSLQFVINRRIKDQYFGELKAALQYECMTSVNKLLVAQNDAKIVDDFVQQLNVLKLNQRELWLTNENDCHKYNQNNFKSNFEGLFKPNIGAKNDALTSFTPNSANTKEKKKINDEKDSELIEAEVALNQRINAWNTDNSELIKGKIEKHRNLKLIDENSSCNDRAHNNSGVYNTLDSDSIIANKCLSTSSVESQGIKNITNSTIGQKSKLAQLNKARALLSNKSSKIGSISENESLKDDLLSFNETASNIPNCDSTFEQNFDNISIIDSDINQKLNLPKNLNISSNISDKCSVQSEGSIQSSDRTSQLSARDKILARHKLTIKQKIAEASKPKIVLPAGFDLRSLPPGKAKPTIQLQNKDDDLLSFNNSSESNIPNCDSSLQQNFDMSIIDSDINQNMNLPTNINVSSNISDKCSPQSQGSIQSSDRTSQLSARDKILARHKFNLKLKIAEASKPKIVLPAGFDLRCLPPGRAKATIQLQNKDDDLLSFNDSSESNIPNCDSSLQQNFDMSIIDSDINQNMNLPTNLNVSHNISDKCSPKSEVSIQSSDRTSQLSARDKILARHKFNLKLKIVEASKPKPKIVLPAGFDLTCLPPGKAKPTVQVPTCRKDYWKPEHSFEESILIDLSDSGSISVDKNCIQSDQVLTPSKLNKTPDKLTTNSKTDFDSPLKNPFDIQSSDHIQKSNSGSKNSKEANSSNSKSKSPPLNQKGYNRYENRKSEEIKGTHNKDEQRNSYGRSNNQRQNNRSHQNNNRRSGNSNNSGSSTEAFEKENRNKNNNQNNRKTESPENRMSNSYRGRQNTNKPGFQEIDEICSVPTSKIGRDSVLVHGTIPIPINRLADALFSPHIHHQMEMLGHKSIYRVQQYCWPHLLRFNSLILVNGEKTGKTFAYLPIICSLVTMEKDDIPEHEKGPVAILLTQSRCEAEQLGKLSKYFTKSTVVCTDEQNLKDSLGKLLNPVDVLVCTINGMKILDEKNNKYRWFSKDRLKHFVVENIDTWNFEKLNELNGIMEKFGIKKIDDIQIVITSRIWSPFLKSLLKLKSFNNPLICIGAHIESAVYANTEFLLKIVQSDLKINCILEFLQKHLYEEQKTIIVCNSNEDTELVATKLRSLSYNTSVCTNKNSADDITKIKTDWKHYDDSRKSILVCTDSTLPDLDIKDAKNLIHYSLSSSWTQTCFRFSVFLKYHEDNLLITDGTFAEPKTLPATTLILLDESNNDHLPRLINFLDRNKIPINSAIRKLVKRIEIEREKSQNSETRPFCSKFLEFGKSHNLSVCLGRHVLTTKDQSNDDIPTNGQIKIQVLSVESPTYYYVRILEYKTLNDHAWKCIRKSNEYTGFSMKFAMYFGDSNNHQTYYPIVLNDICVAVDKGNYYRCKIVNVKKMELRDRIDYTVRAKLVDNGQTLSFRSSQLLYLPKQFRDFPHQAVDLRVLGIIPYDKEEVWDKITLETVRKWIETYSENQKLITTATINFSILNTIFVDEIVIKTELSALNTYVDRILIKKNLIEKKLVLKETDVENNIKELAFELGLLILENDIKSPEKKSSGADSSSNPKSSHSSVSNTSSKCISSNRSGLKTKIQQNVTSEKSNIKKLSQISNESVPKAIKENVKEAVTEGAESKMSKFKESWSNLIQDKFSKVVIGIFYSPDNFYVYNISEYLIDRTNKLYAKIQEHIDEGHAPIDKPSIGQNCLAEFDGNYNRCKIIGLVSENGEIFVTVFYCDIGAIRKMELKSVLTTKEEIVNMLPFQAIRCSLVGLASRKENGLWDKEESNEIYDKFIGPSTSLYSRPVITETPKKDGILEYWNYQIVLLDCSDKAFYDQINKAILAEGLATKDPENEHYMDIFENPDILEKDCDYESEEEEWQDNKYQPNFIYPEQDDLVSSKSFDVHFDDNELKDLLEMAKQTGIYKVVENTPKEACITEINESHVTEKETSCITEIKESDKHKESVERNTAEGVKSKIIKTTVTDNNKQSNDTVSTSEKNVHLKENIPKLRPLSEILKSKKTFISRTNNMKPKPLLKDLYKTPNVVWQQSENLICLYISAPNVTDYTILASRMELFYRAVIDNEINSLCLNLFGPSDCVTHEIRGLSVVVRIEKTLKGKAYQWPRLTNEKDKHSWLKYNYDSLLFEDDENIGLNHFKSNPNIDSDDRSSLGSQSGYDNFVDVTNADNLYDPLDDGHFLN